MITVDSITAIKMTAIEYGGGPTLEQKRSFSGLKDGALIPGYVGKQLVRPSAA